MFHASSDHPTRIAPPLEIVPDQWYAVLESKRLGARPVPVKRLGEELVLYRTASGAVGAMADRCPHRGVALSLGRVVGEEIECGYHAFRFRADGACTAMPCDGRDAKIPNAMRATSFAAREAHGLVWIWWGAAREELPPIPWIPDLPSDEAHSSDRSFVWPVPAFRAVQSSFDYHHAPVLHGKRSLRFAGSVRHLRRFEEVAWEADDEGIELRGVLRREGAPPGGPEIRCHTSFRMPGVSYLRIGSFGRIGVIDTPIDASTTWRWVRSVSPFGHAFGLGRVLAWVHIELDLRFGTQFPEDLPIAVTQAHPGEFFSDIYVKADAGMAQYDRLRSKLLRAARERADAYPPSVRLRLGEGKAGRVSLPIAKVA
jgi:nitrite reductase/ring-hydroxylating ferredoxin subunit